MFSMSKRPPVWIDQQQQQNYYESAHSTSFEPAVWVPVATRNVFNTGMIAKWAGPTSGGVVEESATIPRQSLSINADAEFVPSSFRGVLSSSQSALTAEDWEHHKPTVIRLYRDENIPLKDVVEIMRIQHCFKATIKMYKSKLTAWDVRKYMTKPEREAVCRVIKARQRNGESCGRVFVRGKEKNADVFLRHMGKSRASIRRRELLQSSDSRNDISINTFHPEHLPLSVRPVMYPAGRERSVEVICREMLCLVVASPDPNIALSADLFDILEMARESLLDNHLVEVRILLNRAADWFWEAILTQPSAALLSLLYSYEDAPIARLNNDGLFGLFFQHILGLTREQYGPKHLYTSLVAYIMQIGNEPSLTQRTYQTILTLTMSNLQKHNTAFIAYRLSGSLESSGQYQKAKVLLINAVSSFKGVDPDENLTCCRWGLARHYIEYEPERTEEAERILMDIQKAGTDTTTGHINLSHAYYSNYGLAYLAERRGDLEGAVCFRRLQVRAAVDWWGEDDPQTLRNIHYLVVCLRELGRFEEAEEVRSLIRLTDEFRESDLEEA